MRTTIIVVAVIIIIGFIPLFGMVGYAINMLSDILLCKLYNVNTVLKGDKQLGLAFATTLLWPPILILSKWLCLKYGVTIKDPRFYLFWFVIPYSWGVFITALAVEGKVKKEKYVESLLEKTDTISINTLQIEHFLIHSSFNVETNQPPPTKYSLVVQLLYNQDNYSNVDKCNYTLTDSIENGSKVLYITIHSAVVSYKVNPENNDKYISQSRPTLVRLEEPAEIGKEIKIHIKMGADNEIAYLYSVNPNSVTATTETENKNFSYPTKSIPFELK
ncbi:MAG: hypothetical protein J0M08_12395 [Bacteroidetes bacterium]|nr:hypothetical protein [Bacteroidota bacterium]